MATSNREQNQMQRVTPSQLVKQRMGQMIRSLPGSESARKRFETAAIAVAMSPGIAGCTPESVAKAIYQCARLNLIPDPVIHHAAIVPFKNKGRREATLIIEYRGLVELMKRANPQLTIKAGTVYANDEYEKLEGTEDRIAVTKRHWELGKPPGDPLFFYAVVREPGAEPNSVIVSAVEAEEIGRNSKAGMKPGTPWHDHFERMGEKTCIKRIERFVRMDPDKEETRQFREALEYDERSEVSPEQPGGDMLEDIAMEDSDIEVEEGPDSGEHNLAGQRRRVEAAVTKKQAEVKAKPAPAAQHKRVVLPDVPETHPQVDDSLVPPDDETDRKIKHAYKDAPPYNRIVLAWAEARDIDAQDAELYADHMLAMRHQCTRDTVTPETADELVSMIQAGTLRFELYEHQST